MTLKVPIEHDHELFVDWQPVQNELEVYLPKAISIGIVIEYIRSPEAWDQKKYEEFYGKKVNTLPPITFPIDTILKQLSFLKNSIILFPVPDDLSLPQLVQCPGVDIDREGNGAGILEFEKIDREYTKSPSKRHWCLLELRMHPNPWKKNCKALLDNLLSNINKAPGRAPLYEAPPVVDLVAGYFISKFLKRDLPFNGGYAICQDTNLSGEEPMLVGSFSEEGIKIIASDPLNPEQHSQAPFLYALMRRYFPDKKDK